MVAVQARNFRITISAVAVAIVLAGGGLLAISMQHDSKAVLLPSHGVTMFPDPKPLTAFSLVDHNNAVFDLASLNGKWSFVFLGFTHCPDVCPTTLAVLARVRGIILKNPVGPEDVQFVFVSVDPTRDSADKLRQYVNYFEPRFLGVTGSDAQIRKLTDQLGAKYQVAITPGMEDYPVFHTTAVFLLDPRTRYHALFTPPLDAEAISRRFMVVRQLQSGSAP